MAGGKTRKQTKKNQKRSTGAGLAIYDDCQTVIKGLGHEQLAGFTRDNCNDALSQVGFLFITRCLCTDRPPGRCLFINIHTVSHG